MKILNEIFETIIGLLALYTVLTAADKLVGNIAGWITGIAFVIIVNWVRRLAAGQQRDRAIEVPGKFLLRVKSTMGFNLNDREFILQKGEAVEVRVPDTCRAVGLKFMDREPDDPVTDRILDAKYVDGEM